MSSSSSITCIDCNKTFKHKNSIYNHRKTCKKSINICVEIHKTKEEIKEIKNKYKSERVECNICSKEVSRGNLSTHKKIHQNIEKNKQHKQKNITHPSLEETYDFLIWMHDSKQYFINSLKEFQDAFNDYLINQEPSLNDNDNQEPSLNDNDIQEENIIISISEPSDDNKEDECNNIFEEDEELEYYNNEYSFFKELPNNKKEYALIKPNTSAHYFFKANKFIDRFKKNNLIEHEIKDLKKCQLSIFKIKQSINSLIRLSDDEIYNESIHNRTIELINNNLLTRILLLGIKQKYQELEYSDEDFDKNKILKKIFNELNDMKDNIPDILEKKWKQLERQYRKN